MIFRNISFLILSMCLIVSAQGNDPSNGQDTAGNGMMTDTMEVVGTVNLLTYRTVCLSSIPRKELIPSILILRPIFLLRMLIRSFV